MNKIKKNFVFVCILIMFSATASAFDGPLQVRNQFPLFLTADAPYLDTASLEDSFSAGLSYSSVYLVRASAEWSIGLDMEITELSLRVKKNIKDLVEIGVELPALSFNSGFLDGFINSYHDTFGFPDYGRSNRPDNKFLFDVKRKGNDIVKGRGGRIGIGDVRLTLKTPLLRGDPAVSVRADVELPTGNAETGYGNGSFDTGLALLIDKRLGGYFMSYLNAGVVIPGNFRGRERIDLGKFLYAGTAVEANVMKNLSLVGQVFVQGSAFPKTGISQADRTAVLLSLGGRYHSGSNSFEISFTEDPNTSGAPDFALNFAFKRKL